MSNLQSSKPLTAQLFDPIAAGNYLGLRPQQLAKLRCVGDGPPFFKIGRNIRYAADDLNDWVAGKKFGNTSEYTRGGAA